MPRTTTPRRRFPATLILLISAFLHFLPVGALASPATQSGRSNTADYLELSGYLDAPAISFLVRQLSEAQANDSAVVLLRVDSPGALDASVQPVLHAMVESRVPVVVWIAPGDARAGSAAVALALAAHRAVIAPDATIGPAHPLDLASYEGSGEGDNGSTRSAIAEAAEDRGRNLSGDALDRVLSVQVTAREAVDLGLADGTAATVQELLQSLKGLGLAAGGEQVTLPTDPLTLRFVKMSLLERLAHSALRPEFAYLLLLVGFFGILFELYNPGLGAGGVAGAAALGFSFYAFSALPVSWPAVAALVAAFALLTLDLSRGGLGGLSLGGAVLLLAGTVFLYSGAHPELRLGWAAGIAGPIMTALFFVSVMTSAIRARTARPLPGAEGLMEAVGVARTDIAPDGQVMARGTLWRARTLGAAIGEGSPVKVKGVSGLMLMVEPTNEAPDAADLEAPAEVDSD
ncbi:MAG TPA: NfeD family protein [Actinomycetota bacterium]|nr:NfeD family protein [Actinomycetota bacterium]